MLIFAQNLVGKTISLNVENDTKIEEIKEMLVQKEKLDSSNLRLIFNGKLLDNQNTISSHKIFSDFSKIIIFFLYLKN